MRHHVKYQSILGLIFSVSSLVLLKSLRVFFLGDIFPWETFSKEIFQRVYFWTVFFPEEFLKHFFSKKANEYISKRNTVVARFIGVTSFCWSGTIPFRRGNTRLKVIVG